MDHFGIFTQNSNVNVARFARNVEWDFLCVFQTPCALVFTCSILQLVKGCWRGEFLKQGIWNPWHFVHIDIIKTKWPPLSVREFSIFSALHTLEEEGAQAVSNPPRLQKRRTMILRAVTSPHVSDLLFLLRLTHHVTSSHNHFSNLSSGKLRLDP